MNQPPPVSPITEFKDRHGGLIGFGILVILIGCVCALFVPLMFLGQAMAAKATGGAPDYRIIIPGAVTYVGLAVSFIWLGIGSIMARRWARALLLILAWGWLVMGIITVGIMAVFLPMIFGQPPPGGQPMPDGARVIALVVALGIVSVMFVILPGLLIIFYRSRHVKATCDARDPVVRWTDACPLPVLALSLFLVFGIVSMIPMLVVYHGVMPFFGVLLSGVLGTAMILAMIALWGYCAWATYRRETAGWWVLLISFGVLMVSSALTFARVDLMEMYRMMGYPEKQIEQLQKYSSFMGGHCLLFMSITSLPFLGYLLYVKKYFPRTGRIATA
jgi:MFS family permease